ncbi:DNA-binding protein [Rhodovarius crocodyli]|uniref:DNA-binding protein n=1 Tax=Rhodovarius crocodyli TaxID=1979269 RepID=A0A437M0Z0_9PROT|nr:DNA-binding protein [Rhodovarius crocodyli]
MSKPLPASPAPEDERRIQTPEAARLMGVSRRMVAKLIATGKLPASRIGSRWTLRAYDVKEYIVTHGAVPNEWQHNSLNSLTTPFSGATRSGPGSRSMVEKSGGLYAQVVRKSQKGASKSS